MVANQSIVDRDTAIVQVLDHGVLLQAVGLEKIAMVDDIAAPAALPPSSRHERSSLPDQFFTSIR